MINGIKVLHRVMFFTLLVFTNQSFAEDVDYRLHIHVERQHKFDTWKVTYKLPLATDHIAFGHSSNFDRRKLYQIDETKFKWDKAGEVLLIRSVDGSTFKTFGLTFASFYDFIQKDYTHNLRYSDGSVLLYTNHLALGANIIEDKNKSPIGMSFSGTQFHFYSPNQNIVFLGTSHKDKAQWSLEGDGTYIYFGNIAPIKTDNLIAIVDPKLPKWAWSKTQEYFPKLFDYYEEKTGHELMFTPMVFFNYDNMVGDYSNYSGGTLDGLVQLTINGKLWERQSEEQFNMLFHFLAHEAAHFWNGQMFSFKDYEHSWMHEGGADAFANFAMREFGLIDNNQMVEKFEDATNSCLLNKGNESLTQSAELWKYRNYYTCGATMALASDMAVKATNSSQSVFDVWRKVFDKNNQGKSYNQQDYFDSLSELTKSNALSNSFEEFSTQTNIDNFSTISSWFDNSSVNIIQSRDYPVSVIRHWGKQIMVNLMQMHCNGVSFSSHDDYIETYPLDGCKHFSKPANIQFVDGLDIFKNGIAAYNSFRLKCEENELIELQNREKVKVAEVKCLRSVPKVGPYMRFEQNDGLKVE